MTDDSLREEMHKDPVAEAVVERVKGAVAADSHGQPVVHVPRESWLEAVRCLKEEQQFTQCSDITAVDQLLRPDRPLPPGVDPARFEVVANFLSHPRNRRIRVITQLPDGDGCEVERLFELCPGTEKPGEQLTYVQGPTNVTRMDYAAPLFNELVYSMAVESLLDLEVPPRATWIRMLMCELNRVASHLLFLATNGLDLGAISMMLYGWRERELVLAFFEKVTGLRMNHTYTRPGGVAADLPPGWEDDGNEICEVVPAGVAEHNE